MAAGGKGECRLPEAGVGQWDRDHARGIDLAGDSKLKADCVALSGERLGQFDRIGHERWFEFERRAHEGAINERPRRKSRVGHGYGIRNAVSKPYARPSGKRMIGRNEGAEGLMHRCDHADLWSLERVVGEDEIRSIRRQSVGEALRAVDPHVEGDIRMLCLKACDCRRQHVPGHRFGDGQAHPSPQESSQSLDLSPDVLELSNGLPNIGQVELPRGGRAHAARQALEERRSKLFLEIEDASIQRGRHDVQRCGGLAHRSVASDCVDVREDTRGGERTRRWRVRWSLRRELARAASNWPRSRHRGTHRAIVHPFGAR